MLGIKKNRVDELIEERKERIYFKKAFIYGSIGLGIGATDFILSKKLGVESIFKSFNEMNFHEIITNLYSGISSISAMSGGIMYGVSCLFEQSDKNVSKREIKNIERNLKD
jgi:hypothetical protein